MGPRLLQISGLRYSFDAARPVGQRLFAAELIDGNGVARPLKKDSRYKVVLPDYIAKGGDGYSMFTTGTTVSAPDPLDVDVVGAYIAARSPLQALRAGRINRVK